MAWRHKSSAISVSSWKTTTSTTLSPAGLKSASPSPTPSSPSQSAVPEPESQHDRFFLSDGNIVFRVEKTLYCVHRFFFQQYSEEFAHKYNLCENSEHELPTLIHLEDVETRDFEQLLSIFYPSTWSSPYSETKTVDQWTSVLRLATRWKFTSLRELAVEHLSSIALPIDKVVLGHSFDLPDWLPSAYVNLCNRPEPLSIEEGRRLFNLGQIGGDVVILLNQARHELKSNWGSGVTTSVAVKKVFGLDTTKPDSSVVEEPQEEKYLFKALEPDFLFSASLERERPKGGKRRGF